MDFQRATHTVPRDCVTQVGGSNYDGTFSWTDDKRLCHYDALVVGFANFWSLQSGCNGPKEPGLDALPQLNTNACIQKGPAWLSKPSKWSGCTLTNCGGCGKNTVGDNVLAYQEKGKRILISIGGANADATNMNPTKGIALADAIWNMYLGGSDIRYKGWRPFGPKVVLDGVDIDLEQSPGGCPNSQQCTDVMEGWYNFLIRLRTLMDADTRKDYIITAVPINTKYADPAAGGYPNYGAYTHGYLPGIDNCESGWRNYPLAAGSKEKNALDAQPAKSIFKVAHLIDL